MSERGALCLFLSVIERGNEPVQPEYILFNFHEEPVVVKQSKSPMGETLIRLCRCAG